MHENNRDNTPADEPMKRAEIIIRFDVPEKEASPEYLSTMAAVIKMNLLKPLGKSAEVTGKWL